MTMPDGSIPCHICGQYDNKHKVSCHRSMPLSILTVDDNQEMTIRKIGWECPVCHRGLSPDVTVCEHTPVSGGSAGGVATWSQFGDLSDEMIADVIIDSDQIMRLSGSPINFDKWEYTDNWSPYKHED